MAAVLVTLEKSAKGGMQKFFKYVPAVVLCYLIAMFLCTLGVWDMAETKPAYSALKNNLTYAMIFAMLLRCNIRKVLKLGPKMLIGFFSATLTIMIGFVCAFVLMKGTIGSDVWMGLCALCGSWIGGSGNMVAVQAALDISEADMGYALVIDSIDYSLWVMFLLWVIQLAPKFNKWTKADTSKLGEVSNLLLYAVIGLLASRASLLELGEAPAWIATGFIVLGIHAVLMLIICKLLKLDLFTAGVASLANIGGTASAPVLAGSYSGSLVPVGILMALMGYVVGTPLAVVCAHIMESLA